MKKTLFILFFLLVLILLAYLLIPNKSKQTQDNEEI